MKLYMAAVKYSNLKLLFIVYMLFLGSFISIVKELYAFEKAALGAGLIFMFSWWKFIVATVILLIDFLILSTIKLNGALYAILVLIVVFFVIPSAIIFINIENVDCRIFASHQILFWSILLLGTLKIPIKTPHLSVKSSSLLLGVLVFLWMIPFVILFGPYIDLKNLLLQDVYETRAEVALNVDNLFTNYSYSWLNRFIIPALLVFGLYFKKRLLILFSVTSLIFLFLCGANKVVFAGLIMVLLLYKFDYGKKMHFFLKFIIVITITSWLTALVFNNIGFISIAVRRPFMLPALLDVLYFDFFNDSHLYWSQSITGSFIEYPYEFPHSYIVGQEYFGKLSWNANNGIISDGFMNGGMYGVLINSLIVGFYFSVISQLKINHRFFGLLFLLVFSLVSSVLTTVLLTHGGFILLILATFVLRNTEQKMG